MHSFILIDMSSSMQIRWQETKDAVNGYVATLAQTNPDCRVTIYGFTSLHNPLTNLTPLRLESTAVAYIPLNADTPLPVGMTPLYDALELLDRIMTGADSRRVAAADMRRSVMVVTDGEENVSVKVKASGAKEIIAGWKAREWDVTFLGADFNAFGQAEALGLGAKDVLNAKAGNYASGMRSSAMRTSSYAAGVAPQNLAFSDEDRKAAEGNT